MQPVARREDFWLSADQRWPLDVVICTTDCCGRGLTSGVLRYCQSYKQGGQAWRRLRADTVLARNESWFSNSANAFILFWMSRIFRHPLWPHRFRWGQRLSWWNNLRVYYGLATPWEMVGWRVLISGYSGNNPVNWGCVLGPLSPPSPHIDWDEFVLARAVAQFTRENPDASIGSACIDAVLYKQVLSFKAPL